VERMRGTCASQQTISLSLSSVSVEYSGKLRSGWGMSKQCRLFRLFLSSLILCCECVAVEGKRGVRGWFSSLRSIIKKTFSALLKLNYFHYGCPHAGKSAFKGWTFPYRYYNLPLGHNSIFLHLCFMIQFSTLSVLFSKAGKTLVNF